jgi:hypothetical protein
VVCIEPMTPPGRKQPVGALRKKCCGHLSG